MKANVRPHIVVLGGGFGGLESVFYLCRRLQDRADITLVSDRDYFCADESLNILEREVAMSLRQSLVRLGVGLVVVAALLALAFAAAIPAMHRWGATDAEVVRTLPGDEVLPRGAMEWTHAVTIDAPPAQAWPWVAQLGDERAGFYSYTFVENLVVAALNDPSYRVTYRNANRIVPAWQHPAPGDSFIRGLLRVMEVEQGRWLVVEPSGASFGWSWVWLLEPQQGGAKTRLLVRMRVGGSDAAAIPPAAGFLIDVGAFMMEQRMLQGIALRAEGGAEPAYSEVLEIVIWLSTLAMGLLAAWLFVCRRAWQWPLAVGVAAALGLVGLTIVQPPIWARLILVALLAVGLTRAAKHSPAPVDPFHNLRARSFVKHEQRQAARSVAPAATCESDIHRWRLSIMLTASEELRSSRCVAVRVARSRGRPCRWPHRAYRR